jgi:hypothetical protein
MVLITAKEARELVVTSENEVIRHLDHISKRITAAASLGKRSIMLDYGIDAWHNETLYKVEKPPFYAASFTAFQKILKENLEKYPNNFQVLIVSETSMSGNGLGCISDEPPQPVESWHIKISW